MSNWVGELVANGVGAAIGASIGGYLAFAIGRKQIRQAKLEQCITLQRDIATRNRDALQQAAVFLHQNHRAGSVGHLQDFNLLEMRDWANDLLTLIEVHSPKNLAEADRLLVAAAEAESFQRRFLARRGNVGERENSEDGVYLSELRVKINKLCQSLKSDLLKDASTVGTVSRWWSSRGNR